MKKQNKIIKNWIVFFMIALLLSGLTAIPAETGLAFLSRCFPPDTMIGMWLEKVYTGVANTNRDYPFIAYGYDWLAFAHFVLAILFIGPLRDPVRNKWVGYRIWDHCLFAYYSVCNDCWLFPRYTILVADDRLLFWNYRHHTSPHLS